MKMAVANRVLSGSRGLVTRFFAPVLLLGWCAGWSGCVAEDNPSDEDVIAICAPNAVESCYEGATETEGVGVCTAGVRTCNSSGTGWSDCEGAVTPSTEDCDTAADENCDGLGECSGALRWVRVLGGQGGQMAAAVEFDSRGHAIVSGSFSGTIDLDSTQLESAGNLDFFAVELDSDGAASRSLAFGGPELDLAGMRLGPDGALVISQTFSGAMAIGDREVVSIGDQDAVLYATDWDGGARWIRQFGNPVMQHAGSLAIGDTGDVTVSGYTLDGTLDLGGDPLTVENAACGNYLARYREDGTHVWSRFFDGVDSNWGMLVAVDESGGMVVAGQAQGDVDLGGGVLPGGIDDPDIVLGYFDAQGNHVWSRRFGDDQFQNAKMTRTTDGDIVLAGRYAGTLEFDSTVLTHDDPDFHPAFVAKLAPDGTERWAIDFAANTGVFSVTSDRSGNIIFDGWFTDTVDFGCGDLVSAGDHDGYVVKLASDGTCLWSRRFGGPAMDWSIGSTADEYGNILTAGAFSGSMTIGSTTLTADEFDAFVIKLAP